jgi:hypothetical protein
MKRRKNNSDEKAFKLLARITPELPKLLKKLKKRFENFDISQPQTELRQFENEFAQIIENLSEGTRILLYRFIRRYCFNSKLLESEMRRSLNKSQKNLEKTLSKDKRYVPLFELLLEADKKFPNVSLFASFRHGKLEEKLLGICYPLEHLQDAEDLKGEARAYKVYEAIRQICEYLYKPYIKTLWQFWYLKNGKFPPPLSNEPKFGAMHNIVLEKLADYSELVEKDAMLFRNSPSHTLPHYNFVNDSLVLCDENQNSLEIKVTDLLEKAYSMYQLSTLTISGVCGLYLFQKLLEWKFFEFFPKLFSDIFSGNEQKLLITELKLEEHFVQIRQSFSPEVIAFIVNNRI